MHALNESNSETKTNMSEKEVEDYFDGNICRCTGYRPIMKAAFSATSACPSACPGKQSGTPCHHGIGPLHSGCGGGSTTTSSSMVAIEDLAGSPKGSQGKAKCTPLGSRRNKELVQKHCPQPLRFQDPATGALWYRPVTFEQLCTVIRETTMGNPMAQIQFIGGNTSIGVTKYLNESAPYNTPDAYDVFVDINVITELQQETYDPVSGQMTVGAAKTLSELIALLNKNTHTPSPSAGAANTATDKVVDHSSVFSVTARHLSLIANTQVRNAGSWAGNLGIFNRHQDFPSDAVLALTLAQAILTVSDLTGERDRDRDRDRDMDRESVLHAIPVGWEWDGCCVKCPSVIVIVVLVVVSLSEHPYIPTACLLVSHPLTHSVTHPPTHSLTHSLTPTIIDTPIMRYSYHPALVIPAGQRSSLSMDQFLQLPPNAFLTASTTAVTPSCLVLLSVTLQESTSPVPGARSLSTESYKICVREHNAHAQVNAGFSFVLEPPSTSHQLGHGFEAGGNIGRGQLAARRSGSSTTPPPVCVSARIVYGGVSNKTFIASRTQQVFASSVLSSSLLQRALQALQDDLMDPSSGNGISQGFGDPAYRVSVMQTCLYRAVLRCYGENNLPANLQSVLRPFVKPPSSGKNIIIIYHIICA